MSKPIITIAVDGGAATGKSSTSRGIAEKFNLLHVDTGSHYRAVTLALLESNTALESEAAVTAALGYLDLRTQIEGRNARIAIGTKTPTPEELRSDAVNANVSKVAAIPTVRECLFDYQRSHQEIAQENGFEGLIMEGRDIGSVILPDADFRFFLEADEATRSQRRAAEGQTDSIAQRDKLDSTRKTAPLTCPEGAIRVDTGSRTLEQVIDHISQIILKGLNHPSCSE